MHKRFLMVLLVLLVGVNLAAAQQEQPDSCDPYGRGTSEVQIEEADLNAPAEGATAFAMEHIQINPTVFTTVVDSIESVSPNIAEFANPNTELVASEAAFVTEHAGRLIVYDGACTAAEVLARLNTGSRVTVLDGPIASEGYAWWRVRRAGLTGWVIEGVEDEIWLKGA